MVRFPLAGKPVRHIAGGLGKEEWPRTEERAENCGSRQGYVVVRSSMVGTTSMVMVLVTLIQSRHAWAEVQSCRSVQIVRDRYASIMEKAILERRKS